MPQRLQVLPPVCVCTYWVRVIDAQSIAAMDWMCMHARDTSAPHPIRTMVAVHSPATVCVCVCVRENTDWSMHACYEVLTDAVLNKL